MPILATAFAPKLLSFFNWGVFLTFIYLFIIVIIYSLVPAGSPSRGWDVTIYVLHKPIQLAHSFLFCSCVYFCLCGPFNYISFHKSPRHPSISHSVLLVLILPYWSFLLHISLFMKVSLSPDKILRD